METISKIMIPNFFHKNHCRVCDSPDSIEILNLGEMPISNSFLRKEDLGKPEQEFPLAVYFCKNCGLLQLLDIVNPELIFRQYDYLTSASKPLADHFIAMGQELVKEFIKSKNDLVVEIGGNDAVLLNSIKDNCRVLNIEPARNVAELSRQRGVETISEFFNKKLAEKILGKYGPVKIIVANNVIAHIDDIKDAIEGIKILLKDDGVFVFEVHWVGNLIGEGGFDQIYHEHLSYFSLISLQNLFAQMGLKIFNVRLLPIHGQSLRVYAGKNFDILDSVKEFLEKEKKMGLNRAETFLKFREKVQKNKEDLQNLLSRLKKEGKKIIGYGAPAKGNTLLNYCNIGSNILDYITDSTPLKQGLYTPGTRIPIFAPEKLQEESDDAVDYILLLVWNYAEFVLEKEKMLRENGVKFIIPAPSVKII